MEIPEGYKYLLKEFKGNKIPLRFRTALTEIQVILDGLGIIDKVHINVDLLALSVLDYFSDINRLKHFHCITRVNVDKIYSYSVYWFLRRKPIQIIDVSLQKEFLYINEKVCIAILFPKMLSEMGLSLTGNISRMESFLELFYYNLKFRTYTQQSLELVMEALFCGFCFSSKGV